MKSIMMKASAGSGKTYQLTKRVYSLLETDTPILAVTFTRAAAHEMSRRIIKRILNDDCINMTEKIERLRTVSKQHSMTLDSLFQRLYSIIDPVDTIAADEEKHLLLSRAREKATVTIAKLLAERDVLRKGTHAFNINIQNIIDTYDGTDVAEAREELSEESIRRHFEKIDDIRSDVETLQETLKELKYIPQNRIRDFVVSPLQLPFNKLLEAKNTVFNRTPRDNTWYGANVVWDEDPYRSLLNIREDIVKIKAEAILIQADMKSALTLYLKKILHTTLEREKDCAGKMFFSDISRRLIALDDNPEQPVLTGLHEQIGFTGIRHLLIDESQDTSEDNLTILRPLTEQIFSEIGSDATGRSSFFAVGDKKQMIYRWRGAEENGMKNELQLHQKNKQIVEKTLEYNWRSAPLLIDFFNVVTDCLFNSETRQQYPEKQKGPYQGMSMVAIHQSAKKENKKDIFESVARSVKNHCDKNDIAPGDCTVLTATNKDRESVAAELRHKGIMTSEVKGTQLLTTPEGVALFFILTLLLRQDKPRDFLFRSIEQFKIIPEEKLRAVLKNIAGKFPRPFSCTALLTLLSQIAQHFPPQHIHVFSSYIETYFQMRDTEEDDFVSFLWEMRETVTVPETKHSDRVQLSTFHGSKGLQFPHVFVVWIPSNKTQCVTHPETGRKIDIPKKIRPVLAGIKDKEPYRTILKNAEEADEKTDRDSRRTLYVALTRAVNTVHVFIRIPNNTKPDDADTAMLSELFDHPESFAAKNDIIKTSDNKVMSVHRGERTPPAAAEKSETKTVARFIPPKIRTAHTDASEISVLMSSYTRRIHIRRGETTHKILEQANSISEAADLFSRNDINADTFLQDRDVRHLLSSPGRHLREQAVSAGGEYGIIDRLIIGEEIIIIDYKTGPIKERFRKYVKQMNIYNRIIRHLYPEKTIRSYLLCVDGPNYVIDMEEYLYGEK